MMKHFFVGIKAVIRDKEGKILLLKDSSKKDFWDVPGGRIDENETIQETLKRELDEELPDHGPVRVGNLLNAYRVPGSIKDDLGLLLLFYEVNVSFPAGIQLSGEHNDYKWLSLDDAQKLASDAVQSTIDVLLADADD